MFAPRLALVLAAIALLTTIALAEEPRYSAEFVFPPRAEHNHAPGIVECPNGDLLCSWYRGSGERSADDVAVWGARWSKATGTWGEASVWADTPLFPDCNTCMMVDRRQRLWLFWPLILDNRWDTCLTHYRISTDYASGDPPRWTWQGIIPLIPPKFEEQLGAAIDRALSENPKLGPREKLYLAHLRETAKSKLSNRLGWQPRCKPTVLPSGRILLPLYTDTYSVSVMAISDDDGQTWRSSEALIGFGNIQPSVLRRDDGTLVAYMRENGVLEKIRVAESSDDGQTWGPVGTLDLPNPGSGLDAVRLADGHWLLVYNDTINGRNSLAVSLSTDEGRTWPKTRHLERQEKGAYHYPAIIQGVDGTIHCVYSHFTGDGKNESKTMKHAAFNEAWIEAGD